MESDDETVETDWKFFRVLHGVMGGRAAVNPRYLLGISRTQSQVCNEPNAGSEVSSLVEEVVEQQSTEGEGQQHATLVEGQQPAEGKNEQQTATESQQQSQLGKKQQQPVEDEKPVDAAVPGPPLAKKC